MIAAGLAVGAAGAVIGADVLAHGQREAQAQHRAVLRRVGRHADAGIAPIDGEHPPRPAVEVKFAQTILRGWRRIVSNALCVHAVRHDQLLQLRVDRIAGADTGAADGGQVFAPIQGGGIAVLCQRLLQNGEGAGAAGNGDGGGRYQHTEAHGGGLHADGDGDLPRLVVHRPCAGGADALVVYRGDGDGVGALVPQVGIVPEQAAGLGGGSGDGGAVDGDGEIVAVKLLALSAASLHHQKDGGVLQHQTVRQPHGSTVGLDLGGDSGREQRLAAVGAPEAQDIAVFPGSAVRVGVVQCQGHGSAGVQRDGIAAVGSRRKAASVQTQLLQFLKASDTLHGHPDTGAFAAALHRDCLRAAVGRVTGDGAGLPVGERGVDAEGRGGIGDGVCLRQADAAAGLHGDLVGSGAQLRGVEIAAAGNSAAVDADSLHRLLHIALYRHRRKGQRPLRHGQPAEGGVI